MENPKDCQKSHKKSRVVWNCTDYRHLCKDDNVTQPCIYTGLWKSTTNCRSGGLFIIFLNLDAYHVFNRKINVYNFCTDEKQVIISSLVSWEGRRKRRHLESGIKQEPPTVPTVPAYLSRGFLKFWRGDRWVGKKTEMGKICEKGMKGEKSKEGERERKVNRELKAIE